MSLTRICRKPWIETWHEVNLLFSDVAGQKGKLPVNDHTRACSLTIHIDDPFRGDVFGIRILTSGAKCFEILGGWPLDFSPMYRSPLSMPLAPPVHINLTCHHSLNVMCQRHIGVFASSASSADGRGRFPVSPADPSAHVPCDLPRHAGREEDEGQGSSGEEGRSES